MLILQQKVYCPSITKNQAYSNEKSFFSVVDLAHYFSIYFGQYSQLYVAMGITSFNFARHFSSFPPITQ